jgi:phosphoribosyl 1,2-cyclic phosphodiesterase
MTRLERKVRFWGVRGSVPTPTLENLRYGGNTSCLAVALAEDRHLILDCGTGIRLLGNALGGEKRTGTAMEFDVLFSHYHLDHIEGLPFFSPLYDPRSRITFHGFSTGGKTVKEVLEGIVSPPYFPVPLGEVPSQLRFVTIDGTSTLEFGDVRVNMLPLNHPNGSLSYRLERGDRRIVYATDHEHGVAATDSALIRFCEGADYLIYDATYVPSEYEMLRRGWGHSTWYEGVHVARAAKVKTLVLFHHHPGHTDEQLESVLRVAREELPSVEIAREGMELPL